MLNIDNKIVWLLIIIGVLLPILTNFLASVPSSITMGNPESWIGYFGAYFGSIVGGIMGALIAFGVAKYQIDNQKQYENKKLYVAQLPELIKIKIELDVIKLNLETSKKVFHDGKASYETKLLLKTMDTDDYSDISKIYDSEIQAELISLRQYHKIFFDKMYFDFIGNRLNIDKYEIEIERLNKKKKRNRADENKLLELNVIHDDLVALHQMTISDKEFLLSSLDENIRLTNDLVQSIDSVYQRAKEISSELGIRI